MQCIAFDAHKQYTWAVVEDEKGKVVCEQRIARKNGAPVEFLASCEPGSPVAVETIGNWYWIADEIEAAGMVPRLVHACKAKGISGSIDKTVKLDVRGIQPASTIGNPTDGVDSAAGASRCSGVAEDADGARGAAN